MEADGDGKKRIEMECHTNSCDISGRGIDMPASRMPAMGQEGERQDPSRYKKIGWMERVDKDRGVYRRRWRERFKRGSWRRGEGGEISGAKGEESY